MIILLVTDVAYAKAVTEGPGTDHDIALLIIYVLLAVLTSFVCSIAESVLLCITPSYIESIRDDHRKLSALLKSLRIDNVDQSFAAILSLNTIANTVGAVMAGSQAKVIFGSAWVGMFSALLTLMILFLSEIIPKTIGAIYWKKLAGAVAVLTQAMIFCLYPIVWFSEKLTKKIGRDRVVHVFSRDEMIAMAEIGRKAGAVEQHESRVFNNLFRLVTLTAADIMTPRVVISALPQDMRVAEAFKALAEGPFSRIPVYTQDLDDITGFVLKDQILLLAARGEMETRIETLKREIPVVPESLSLSKLLNDMLELRQHIAVVIDEYGGTAGLVTMEDAIETLLGMEIKDEMDNVEDMRHLARKKWEERAGELGIDIDKTAADHG
ncbi:MAG: HlyC/CorC family transporter [Spartobacteria bacterium]|nr:HlyC/CorC family transporter [Spartobacteria bacterium]